MNPMLLLVVCCVLGTTTLLFGTLKLLPQVEMTLKNKCKSRVNSWNGKIFNIQVWTNSFKNRPKHFSIHYTGEGGGEEEFSDIKYEFSYITYLITLS